jgi:hypothetical protein
VAQRYRLHLGWKFLTKPFRLLDPCLNARRRVRDHQRLEAGQLAYGMKEVIGKTPGHQPATLQVHGSIANIMASMEVLDLMGQQFLAAAQNDFMTRLASGELDTGAQEAKTPRGLRRGAFEQVP